MAPAECFSVADQQECVSAVTECSDDLGHDLKSLRVTNCWSRDSRLSTMTPPHITDLTRFCSTEMLAQPTSTICPDRIVKGVQRHEYPVGSESWPSPPTRQPNGSSC